MSNASIEVVNIDTRQSQIRSKLYFGNYEDFENWFNTNINGISETKIILLVSKKTVLNLASIESMRNIYAVYDQDLTCLYCSPVRTPEVQQFIKNKIEIGSRSSRRALVGNLVRKYWFLVGLIVSILLAYLFPDVGKKGGYIRSEWTIKYGAVIIIFFLSGLSLRTRQLGKEILNIRLHILVQASSFLIIPTFVYALSWLLAQTSFNPMLIFGIIVMSSTSTTISSNVVMTKNAHGNEYAALLNAVLGNFLGIFISPLLIYGFMQNSVFNVIPSTTKHIFQFDYLHTVKNLTLNVLLPLFIGQIIHLLWTKEVMRIRERLYFAEINSLALLTLVWSTFCTTFANGLFRTINVADICILIALDSALYVFFSLLFILIAQVPIPCWKFSEKDTVAIVFCGATKTLAMGIPLINALFEDQNQDASGLISLPLIVYHAVQLILGAFEVILLGRWVKKREKRKDSRLKRINLDEEQELDRLESK